MQRYLVPILMLLSLIACMPRGAHAQTPSGGSAAPSNYYTVQDTAAHGASPAAACTAWDAQGVYSATGFTGHWCTTPSTGRAIMGPTSCSGSSLTVCQAVPPTCPGGSSLVGASCVCPAGTTSWNGSACVSACVAGGENQFAGDAGSVRVGCINGCTTNIHTTVCRGLNGLGGCSGFGTKTGAECTVPLAVTNAHANPCGPGETPMIINGTQLCAVSGGASSTRTLTTTTNADGSKVITSNLSNCVDGACVNTSSSQPYDASGDATGNATTEEKSEQEKLTMGSPVDTALGTQAVDLNSLTPVAMGTARSCPADVPLAKGTYFTWSGACFVADNGVRAVILAMSWLAAGLIAFGGVRS